MPMSRWLTPARRASSSVVLSEAMSCGTCTILLITRNSLVSPLGCPSYVLCSATRCTRIGSWWACPLWGVISSARVSFVNVQVLASARTTRVPTFWRRRIISPGKSEPVRKSRSRR